MNISIRGQGLQRVVEEAVGQVSSWDVESILHT